MALNKGNSFYLKKRLNPKVGLFEGRQFDTPFIFQE